VVPSRSASRSNFFLPGSLSCAGGTLLIALVPALGLAQQRPPCKESADSLHAPQALVVQILGAVTRPCWYFLQAGKTITVSQALLLAGGLSEAAKTNAARVVHRGSDGSILAEITLDLGKAPPSGGQNVELAPGDILFVPVLKAYRAVPHGPPLPPGDPIVNDYLLSGGVTCPLVVNS
jgi:hypothetical protein